MRIHPLCPSCLLNRVYYEAKLVTDDPETLSRCVDEALKILASEFSLKPVNAHLATKLHRRVYEILGCEDPYRSVKSFANEVARRVVAVAEKVIEEARDKFRAAVKAAIIANNFDYGVMGHEVVDREFEEFFRKRMREEFAIDDVDRLKELSGGKVVYLTDNAGEIFFDALLMRELKKRCEKLSVVVRGRPILNDATLEDAKLAGIDRIADELLTNGMGAIGIIFEELPPNTIKRLEEADLIVAKGMANYECLSEAEFRPIAFLLTAKCEPVAESLGVPKGSMVVKVVE
ncbi:MAG: DUF89 domain-containing protein [Archaeoglobaceae archaeon]